MIRLWTGVAHVYIIKTITYIYDNQSITLDGIILNWIGFLYLLMNFSLILHQTKQTIYYEKNLNPFDCQLGFGGCFQFGCKSEK